MIGRARAAYGEGLLHLVGHLAFFVAAGFAVVQLVHARAPVNIFAWLVGAALVHDLLFAPLYVVADRAARVAAGRGGRHTRVSALNHVRVVVVVCGVLALVYFPLILQRAPGNYRNATGHPPPDYLGRWLAISAGIVLLSAAAYAVRRARGGGVEELQHPVGAPADEDASGA